jgi:hypothetical protein
VVTSLARPLAPVGILMLAMAIVATRLHSCKRYRDAAITLVLCMVALQLALSGGVVPALERHKVSPALAAAVRANSADSVPVYWYSYEEPSFIFYVGRHVEKVHTEKAIAAWANEAGPAVLLLPRATLDKLVQAGSMPELAVVGEKAGFNYSNGKFVDIVALRRP